MSLSKISSLQAYHMGLYRSAIHPEFFRIEGRSRIAHGDYEFEAWICHGGHALRFEHNGLCVTEAVSEEIDQLPDRGHVTTLPCAGERDHEADFAERINYVTSIQTETLTDHLYLGTYNEMLEHGRMGECLMSVWKDGSQRPNLSLLDYQRYGTEVHVQAYHLRSDCSLVLRTQSIFQIKD
ncbi:MAG: hypothetical protein HKN62_17465 [Phycisphaerales bacterium]|nr:hypothetical protein [Phycisphaerales bacterium]